MKPSNCEKELLKDIRLGPKQTKEEILSVVAESQSTGSATPLNAESLPALTAPHNLLVSNFGIPIVYTNIQHNAKVSMSVKSFHIL